MPCESACSGRDLADPSKVIREAPALWLVVKGSPWVESGNRSNRERREDRDWSGFELSESLFLRRGNVRVFFFGGAASPVGAVVIMAGAKRGRRQPMMGMQCIRPIVNRVITDNGTPASLNSEFAYHLGLAEEKKRLVLALWQF